MKTSNSTWKKSFKELVDQRMLPLPPTWVAKDASSQRCSERGSYVHESGRGRVVTSLVVALLGQARTRAVVSSFLLADRAVEDAILSASKLGVRIYVLLASEARLGRAKTEDEFDKRVLAEHEAMLLRLGGHVMFRSAPHFHAKLVIVDPEDRPAGVLLTANLTSEALERNEELTIVLTPEEVREAALFMKWAMWESADHELVDPNGRFRPVRPLGKVGHPSSTASLVATTSQANTIRNDMLALVDDARSHILVSSFGWDADHAVVKRLCARARAGVDVTVLARVRPSAMPALFALAEAGAHVFGFRWLHAKAIWTDSQRALVMSANLQADGLDRGFELGVRLSGARAREVKERLVSWRAAAPWELLPAPTLGKVSGQAMIWSRGRLDDVNIEPVLDVALGLVKATSADDITASRPSIPSTGDIPRLAHKLRCVWTAEAPTMAPKSKEILRPARGKQPAKSYSPPVFREPGGRLVIVVRSSAELADASAVMAEVGAAAIVLAEGTTR
jgi:cardiolipin synthase